MYTRTSVDVTSTFSAASALRRTVDPRRVFLRVAHVTGARIVVVVRADVEAMSVCVCSIERRAVARSRSFRVDVCLPLTSYYSRNVIGTLPGCADWLMENRRSYVIVCMGN